jgi:hypothetical protein
LLLSEEFESRRQLEQIEWHEMFLKYQRQLLTPSDFLYRWNKHMRLKIDSSPSTELFQGRTEVWADIIVSLLSLSQNANPLTLSTHTQFLSKFEVTTEEALRELTLNEPNDQTLQDDGLSL